MSVRPETSLQWVCTRWRGGSNSRISPLSTYGFPPYSPRWTSRPPGRQSASVSTPKNHCFISLGVVIACHTRSIGASIVVLLRISSTVVGMTFSSCERRTSHRWRDARLTDARKTALQIDCRRIEGWCSSTDDVLLDDTSSGGDAVEPEDAQVGRHESIVDDQFSDRPADRGRLLDPVAAEPVREQEIRDLGMPADDRVVIERVHLVVASPGIRDTDRVECGHAVRERRPQDRLEQRVVRRQG